MSNRRSPQIDREYPRIVTLWIHFLTCLARNTDGPPNAHEGHEGTEGEYRCSSTLSLISTLNGGGWTKPHSGHPTRGKEPVSIVYVAGWAPEPVWTGAENLASPGFDPWTTQTVAGHYTDWAIAAGPHTNTRRLRTAMKQKCLPPESAGCTDDWCGLLAAPWNRPFWEAGCLSAGPLHFVEP